MISRDLGKKAIKRVPNMLQLGMDLHSRRL